MNHNSLSGYLGVLIGTGFGVIVGNVNRVDFDFSVRFRHKNDFKLFSGVVLVAFYTFLSAFLRFIDRKSGNTSLKIVFRESRLQLPDAVTRKVMESP